MTNQKKNNEKRNSIEKKEAGVSVAAIREIIEGEIGKEAFARAGKCPQIKGIIHEVIKKDAYNANPKRLFDGTKAVLSKSTTAVRDDILIKKGTVVPFLFCLLKRIDDIAEYCKNFAYNVYENRKGYWHLKIKTGCCDDRLSFRAEAHFEKLAENYLCNYFITLF